MKREFLQNLKVGEQTLPKEVIDAIMEEHGKSVQSAKVWQEKYEQAMTQHARQVQEMKFAAQLNTAILQAKGRSTKAITALLDIQSLQSSEDPQTAIGKALEKLKQESAYLFEQAEIQPSYAQGTGALQGAPIQAPTTLAGALRERFEK